MVKILKKRQGCKKENHICHFKKIHYCLSGSSYFIDYIKLGLTRIQTPRAALDQMDLNSPLSPERTLLPHLKRWKNKFPNSKLLNWERKYDHLEAI